MLTKRTGGLFIQYFPFITSNLLSTTVLRNFIAKVFHLATRQVVYLPMQIVYLPMFQPAISYVHKILNLQNPAEVFLVKKIIQGGHHSAPCKDSRLPVTGRILANIMRDISTSIRNLCKKRLLMSFFLLNFNAFLRLGEIVLKTKTDQHNVI